MQAGGRLRYRVRKPMVMEQPRPVHRSPVTLVELLGRYYPREGEGRCRHFTIHLTMPDRFEVT